MNRSRWLLAAAFCVAATWLPLLIGATLDLHPFLYWGVLSSYIGVSWLLPGVFAGVAAAEWMRMRGKRRSNRVGAAVGVGVGAGLIVGWASLLVALGGADSSAEPTAKKRQEGSDPHARVDQVSKAARRTGYAHVDIVMCERKRVPEAHCVVTYAGPSCQLWSVVNVDGVDTATPLQEPAEGGQGTYSEERDSIGCFVDLSS